MRITDFDIYKDLLKKYSGLAITQDKSYLLDSRLTPIAKKWGYSSLEAMTLALRGVPDTGLIKDVVEAMTTNETSFFRDQNPFDLFTGTVLPYLQDKRRKGETIRIWCAACSSGQEPYSLAMLLKENPHLVAGRTVDILGTDIAEKVLDKAQSGLFSQFDVQRGMPAQLLLKYFSQEGDMWRLNDDIRSMVTFTQFNLLDSMESKGIFDVIYCRNVLIYFDEDTKRDILDRMARQLAPDGFLFLGGAESVLGISDLYDNVPNKRGMFILKDGAHDKEALSA